MAHAHHTLRRLVAGGVIVALLPATPVMLSQPGTSRHTALGALAAYALLVVALVPWLWPQRSRLQGVLVVGMAFSTTFVGYFAALVFVIFSLCGSGDNGRTYLTTTGAGLTVVAFVVRYLGFSTWAIAKPARTAWAWPLAIPVAGACAMVTLALVEGGTHHYST